MFMLLPVILLARLTAIISPFAARAFLDVHISQAAHNACSACFQGQGCVLQWRPRTAIFGSLHSPHDLLFERQGLTHIACAEHKLVEVLPGRGQRLEQGNTRKQANKNKHGNQHRQSRTSDGTKKQAHRLHHQSRTSDGTEYAYTDWDDLSRFKIILTGVGWFGPKAQGPRNQGHKDQNRNPNSWPKISSQQFAPKKSGKRIG